MTSHDVVSRVRSLAGTRKVGHAGTLDPMATGVLVVGVGRATRLLGHLLLADKAYDATIRLGVATTTDDADGEVVASHPAAGLDDDAIREALARFVGSIEQVPSSVSAVKVDGRRAYERVRAGEQVDLAARSIRIDAIDVRGDTARPTCECRGCGRLVFTAAPAPTFAASRETWARALGVGGHLIALRRTAVGPFGLDEAHTLDELDERFDLMPLAQVARPAFSSYDLDEQQTADVRFGRKLAIDLGHEGPVAVFGAGDEFLALYEQAGEQARAVAVFTG